MRRSPILLAVAALFLIAASSCSSSDSGSEVPAEVEQIISAYEQTYADQDVDAFYETVTDDFQHRRYIYATATQEWSETLTEPDGADEVAHRIEFSDRTEAANGDDWVVTGEHPWFVSMSQTWSSETQFFDGNATYVVADQDGTMKIAGQYYTATVINPES